MGGKCRWIGGERSFVSLGVLWCGGMSLFLEIRFGECGWRSGICVFKEEFR